MMDKDKILPLTGNEGILCFPQCHENQRDTDWERVKGLVEALQTLANPNSWATGGPKAIFVKVLAIAQVALAQLSEEVKP